MSTMPTRARNVLITGGSKLGLGLAPGMFDVPVP